MEPIIIKKGVELELQIESLAYGGKGIAKIDNFVIFVKGAIPGQTVKARVYKKKKGFAEANTLEVIKESPKAVDVKCDHFGVCGGCKIQNLSYDEQLKEKADQVEGAFRRLGGFSDFSLDDSDNVTRSALDSFPLIVLFIFTGFTINSCPTEFLGFIFRVVLNLVIFLPLLW